jgi:hypothetical protein
MTFIEKGYESNKKSAYNFFSLKQIKEIHSEVFTGGIAAITAIFTS